MDDLYMPCFSVYFRRRKALAAKHRSVACGLERYSCVFSAVGARYREVLLAFSLITARLASLRLVLEALFGIEFLLACRKNELLTTVLAN